MPTPMSVLISIAKKYGKFKDDKYDSVKRFYEENFQLLDTKNQKKIFNEIILNDGKDDDQPTLDGTFSGDAKLPVIRHKEIHSLGLSQQAYGTGRRKKSVARVYVRRGAGIVEINNKPLGEYFKTRNAIFCVLSPLSLLKIENELNIYIKTKGGGFTGQSEAIRLGLSRALAEFSPNYRRPLKAAGFLKVDSRKVERSKPGQPKARKKFQYSKR